MLIVLEGVDGSGKSSLADAIAAALGKRVQQYHHGPLKQDPLQEYVLLSYNDYIPGQGTHLVIDRLHWGELVYGPLYRGASALTVPQFRWIELWMMSRGATTWRVSGPLETILARLQARGEDFLQTEHVQQVIDGFAAVEKLAPTAAGLLEPQGDTTDMVHQVIALARYMESRANDIAARYPSFIGDTIPHTLLVGDVRGGKPPHPTTSAFLPVNGNSGAFLLDSLDDDWWRNIAVVNGVEEGERLPQLIEDLYGPQVVALGRNASNALKKHKIAHGSVPHPQKVRRFHNKLKTRYGRLIREVARTGEAHISWPK